MSEEVFVEHKPTEWAKLFLSVVLGLGLLTGAAYAGYYYGTRETSNLKNKISETPTPKPTTPIIDDETKDWEVYRNDARGYLIKYPSSLEIFAETDEKLELANFQASEAAHGVFVPKKGFYVTINAQSPEKAIEDFAEGSPYEAEEYEEVDVGGSPASKITSKAELGPDTFLRTIVVYIPTDNYTYVLNFSFYEKDAQEFAPLVKQILSHFQVY